MSKETELSVFSCPTRSFWAESQSRSQVFAPDGEQLGTQIYSFGSLNAAILPENNEDNTQPLVLQRGPQGDSIQ